MVTLADIRGQERPVSLLRRYLASGRLPGGFLFSGEEGIGKETAASAFAGAVLCRRRAGGDACGACPDCLRFGAGSHPNFLRLAPEGNSISVDGIRAFKEELSLRAFAEGARVALIVPAEKMTPAAANALLKTLEEPPAATHLLLVTHRLSQLLPTIVSRCQKVPFSPLPAEEVEAILLALPRTAGKHPEAAIRAAAAASEGSPGRALSLLAGAGDERDTWVRLLSRLSPEAVFAFTEKWKKSEERGSPLAVPLTLLRDLVLLSSAPDAAIMNEDLRDALRAVAGRKPPYGWTRILQALLDVSRMPPQHQKRLSIEALLFSAHGKERS